MQTARRCAADSKKENPVAKTHSPMTRRELIRRSSLAAAGLAAVPLLAGARPASAQGGVELVFWDSLFIEDEAIPIDQWFITQAIARFHEEFPDIRINRVAQ
jgi:hypothetical protein